MNTNITQFISDLVVLCETMLKEDRPAEAKSRIRHVRSHLKDAAYIAEGLDRNTAYAASPSATGPSQNPAGPPVAGSGPCICPGPGVRNRSCPAASHK